MATSLKTYKIKGMHCASCAGIIEKAFRKTDGVQSADVNYGTETAKVSFDESKTSAGDLSKKIEKYGYSLEMSAADMGMSAEEHMKHTGIGQSKNEKLAEISKMKRLLVSAIPLSIISVIMMAWNIASRYGWISDMPSSIEELPSYFMLAAAAYILLFVGRPYLFGVYRFARYGKANMDTLIGIGTSTAFLYSVAVTIFSGALSKYIDVSQTYFDVTIIVITFIALGKYLEARSKIKTGDAIEKLLNLQAKTALVVRNGNEVEIPVHEVIHGDIIIVKPGAKIPVDGVVVEGETFVDESMVTGEPMPVQKRAGATLVAGTLNTTGSCTFKATKVGSETLLAQIIHMVEEAQGSKAPIQAMADKISSVFVPIVLGLSVLTLAIWLSIGSQYLGFSQALSFGLVSFVGILVIACPCALGLATPTAIIVGVGKGAKEGILIKDAATLEKLHKVTTVVVDKTGTITKGKPTLADMKNLSQSLNDRDFISIVASLEKKSEHPIAHAIVNYAAENKIDIWSVTGFESIKGKGLKGTIDGTEYYVGNAKLMSDLKVHFDASQVNMFTSQGKTPVILATNENMIGFMTIADEIKPESIESVRKLHELGIDIVMLTGDDERAAKFIASQVGIDGVVAHALPQDKLAKIKELQTAGKIVAMAGDGVNDAPALAQADVGIAMGTGTDVAIESAGITLLGGDISKLVKAINLSKVTMRGIKQNLFWAFIYNVVGIPLAAGALYPAFGILLNPIFAGMAMAFSSVSVVSNSLRIKTQKL